MSEFDLEEEEYEENKMTLRNLFYNMHQNETVIIKIRETGYIKASSVRIIEEQHPEWLDLLVDGVSAKNSKINILLTTAE